MRTRLLAFICLTTLVFGLVACAPNSVNNPASLKQMDQQARGYTQREYVIAPGDTLDIKFVRNPEFNELLLPVRPDGRISLQMAPDIKVAGLTPSQLRGLLTEKYGSELKNPDIAVIVRAFADQRIFVDGEVLTPGIVEMRGPTTVMRAISQARGLRETARLSNIIVIRKDFEGQPMAANLDLRKVINGTDMSQDITLMPYDIVYVPKSNIANWLKFVDEYINRAVPGGFPGFAGFANPYAYALGGFTKVYPDSGATVVAR